MNTENNNQDILNKSMNEITKSLELYHLGKIDLTELLKQVQTISFKKGVKTGIILAEAAMKEALGNYLPASKGKL